MHKQENSLPHVIADHLPVEDGCDLAIITCPFCGKEHEHGWASGTRIPHCMPQSKGQYYLDCGSVNDGQAVYRVKGVQVSYQEYLNRHAVKQR